MSSHGEFQSHHDSVLLHFMLLTRRNTTSTALAGCRGRTLAEYLGEQRRKRRERESRVAREGKSAKKITRYFFRALPLVIASVRLKYVLLAIGPQNGKGGDARQFF